MTTARQTREELAGLFPIPFAEPKPDLYATAGWRAFVSQAPLPRPPQMTRGAYEGLDAEEQRAYNEQRLAYVSGFGPVQTPQMVQLHARMLNQLTTNVCADLPRPGSVLDASGGMGKSTVLRELAVKWELDRRRAYVRARGTPPRPGFIPVVNVHIEADMSVQAFCEAILDFYDAPYVGMSPHARLRSIRRCVESCETSLITVDDVHNLKMRYQRARAVNDQLKTLMSLLPVTFMYAGVDVEGSGLYSEGSADDTEAVTQTYRRFARLEMTPFTYRPAAETDDWRQFLTAVERELRLLDAADNVLSGQLAEYLYERTNGHLGSTWQLIRNGAVAAMFAGVEDLTTHLLDGITIDWKAERDTLAAGRRTNRDFPLAPRTRRSSRRLLERAA